MSLTTIPSSARMGHAGTAQHAHANSATLRSSESGAPLAAFVDLQYSPYNQASSDGCLSGNGSLGAMPTQNPVPDLIPDEVYYILCAHDLISEKGIRDHIIRKEFKTMREEQALKSSEALARLQAVYPYLQIDTIRKIIYRIGPAGGRKAMMI